ncbi:MAG: serine/threonine-protein kinase [Nannocystaceae bacterium]
MDEAADVTDTQAARTVIADPNAPPVTPPPAELDEHDEMIGRIIDDRYRVIERLGEGGMGAVYVAEHRKLRKHVALKIIRAELAGDGEIADRFAREAMVTAQLDHPHIASAMDYGPLPEGGAYLVIELVRGQGLDKRLSEGALSWPQACELGGQLADALTVAHARGIVHRDLKPENILLETRDDGGFRARVLDFGIARVDRRAGAPATPGEGLTQVGMVIGSPGYMAPEQATGAAVDARSDLYSLGVILWECIAGRRLWTGVDMTELFGRQLTEDPPPVTKFGRDIPHELADLISRLLSRSPSGRPEKASEVRALLKRLAFQATAQEAMNATTRPTLTALAERVRVRAEPLITGLRTTTFEAFEELRERRPGRRAALLGAIAAALLLLVIVCVVSGDDEPPEDDDAVAIADSSAAADEPDAPDDAPDDDDDDSGEQPAAPATSPVPKDLKKHAGEVLTGKRSASRKKAAKAITAHKPADAVPKRLRLVAELELARKCKDKSDLITALGELGDPWAMPALQRVRKYPKDTCGNIFSRRDCWSCLRSELDRAIAKLELAADKGE